MDQLIIEGGRRLEGSIPISGAKNSALTLMPAALLTDEPLTLRNLPRLADVDSCGHLMNHLGVGTEIQGQREPGFGRVMTLRSNGHGATMAPYDMVRRMRASILVLGPLVASRGEAVVSQPGGCAIGNRPIDLHLKALETLGAEIELDRGYVRARAPGGLRSARIVFPTVSVGATENAMMAAALARGTSVIENAAREPEIVDLGRCLVAMGARIEGLGTDRIEIEGRPRLHGATHAVMPDRIETGSYACAVAITGGRVVLEGADRASLGATIAALEEAGVRFSDVAGGLLVERPGALEPVTVQTAPWPGLATDMQAQIMALVTLAAGASILTETIFENRYMHVPELVRMGADITVRGRSAMVRGVEALRGAPVMATDLRASMSLVIAALAARGETRLSRVYHLDRGYERLEEKLSAVGARVERVSADV